jgi:hypothetical protein
MISILLLFLSESWPGSAAGGRQNESSNFLPVLRRRFSILSLPVYIKPAYIYCIAIAVVLSAAIINMNGMRLKFKSDNYAELIGRLTGTNRMTQVISAVDDTLYTLQVKLVNTVNGQPISGISINASSAAEGPDISFNIDSVTDHDGACKLPLDKGTFLLSFTQTDSGERFVLPPPFYYELKNAGTTVITVNLDPATQPAGIAEILVLDPRNMPVSQLELKLEQEAADDSGMLLQHENSFSLTNEEGIAVFKAYPGTYNVSFTKADFPADYSIPLPFKIKISPDISSIYTLRLSDSSKVYSLSKSGRQRKAIDSR